MEVSFAAKRGSCASARGEVFRGEGILAITKALLQSGVAYVGGYQGAPVSHLLDVLVQSKDYLAELGVHVEACANEASAAAMLGASIHYPLRGAVTWKSIVGTNVAADALSNLASPGVTGGALIIVGEDYGEGASVIQERTYAFALKSSLILLDPRPDLAHMVRMVEEGFALSEAASMPVRSAAAHPRVPRARQLHLQGQRGARDVGAASARRARGVRLRPPVASAVDVRPGEGQDRRAAARRAPLHRRAPAERAFRRHARRRSASSCKAASTTTWSARCSSSALADAFGAERCRRCSCSTSRTPLVPEEIRDFCAGKRAVLVVEEGQPEFIEQEIATLLRRQDIGTPIHGKDVLPMAGEYTVEVIARGVASFAERHAPDVRDRRRPGMARGARRAARRRSPRRWRAAAGAAAAVLHRLPRAAGVRRAEARAAGHRPAAHRRRHRLPRVRDVRAVLDRATRSWATA